MITNKIQIVMVSEGMVNMTIIKTEKAKLIVPKKIGHLIMLYAFVWIYTICFCMESEAMFRTQGIAYDKTGLQTKQLYNHA